VFQAATQNGALWLQQKNLGGDPSRSARGSTALNADPFADIKNLRQIYRVMLDGPWVEASPAK
jgi:hypothetical protein